MEADIQYDIVIDGRHFRQLSVTENVRIDDLMHTVFESKYNPSIHSLCDFAIWQRTCLTRPSVLQLPDDLE